MLFEANSKTNEKERSSRHMITNDDKYQQLEVPAIMITSTH
jgi:hypothetical protein